MPLDAGHKLGPYEILAIVGEGGMGEVYKARDTRLDRIVAIKLAKSQFSERFEREARAVASLNHRYICQLFDVGPNYLVMEFVDGQPLRGPMPLDKAVSFAGQILEALHAAHQKRITHRDLKPANILVTAQGIKLLDFGLAKVSPLTDTDATMVAASSKGEIVGTLQYMAPEQLQGKPVDARSDIFAFGCVFYELLTGRRAFSGESAASVIAAILERKPEPAQQVPQVERILATCLEKDPEHRFQDALDLKRTLEWAVQADSPTVPAKATASGVSRKWITILGSLIIALSAALVYVLSRPQAAPEFSGEVIRLTRDGRSTSPALSPDGRLLAYVSYRHGNAEIYVQQMSGTAPVRLTNHEAADIAPEFSPDASTVYFTSFREPRGIYEVPTFGGEARLVLPNASHLRVAPGGKNVAYETPQGTAINTLPLGTPVVVDKIFNRNMVWSPDGSELVASFGDQFWRIGVDGKKRTPLPLSENLRRRKMFTQAQTSLVRWLPDDDLLITALAGQAVNVFRVPLAHAGTAPPTAVTLTTAQNLMLGAWESGKAVIAVNQMRASPWSLPCDLNTGTVNGELRQVTEGQAGGAHPAIMRDGSLLAYASSKTGSQSLFLKDLRTGRERLLAAPLDSGGALAHVHFSPDGKQVVASHSRQSVKSYTLVTVPTVGGEMKPFHPEGSRVRAWSPDGRWVLVWLPANNQIAVIDVISRKQTVLLSDGFTEPSLSADGKWLAFVAQQGRQLYVAPFRGDQAISKELWIPIAGQVGYPFWAPDGNSLYYAPSPGMDFSTEASTTIVRRKLDPQTKQPLGDAAVFFRSEGMIFGSAVTNPIPVARDQIILQMNVINSDLWALDVPARRR